MTAEELIIGHYEKSLTSDQESHLAEMVDASPDVRNLYEQHGNVHNLMVSEAAAVKPSSKLDKVVVGAALGTLVEIAGHGIGFSILGKVASVIGAVAVGGIGFVLYDTYVNDDDAKPTPAVVRDAPRTSVPTVPTDETPSASTEVESPAQTDAATGTVQTPGKNSTSVGTSTRSTSDQPSPRTDASRKPKLTLDGKSVDAVVKPDTIRPIPRPNSR